MPQNYLKTLNNGNDRVLPLCTQSISCHFLMRSVDFFTRKGLIFKFAKRFLSLLNCFLGLCMYNNILKNEVKRDNTIKL